MVADRRESREVGLKDGGESKRHESGGRVVDLLEKQNKDDYTDEDPHHMRKVVSYVHRHQAQKPEGDVENSNWRYLS